MTKQLIFICVCMCSCVFKPPMKNVTQKGMRLVQARHTFGCHLDLDFFIFFSIRSISILTHNHSILFDAFATALHYILFSRKARCLHSLICMCEKDEKPRIKRDTDVPDRQTGRGNSAMTGTLLLPSDNDMACCQILAEHLGRSKGRGHMETTGLFFFSWL